MEHLRDQAGKKKENAHRIGEQWLDFSIVLPRNRLRFLPIDCAIVVSREVRPAKPNSMRNRRNESPSLEIRVLINHRSLRKIYSSLRDKRGGEFVRNSFVYKAHSRGFSRSILRTSEQGCGSSNETKM